MECYACHNPAIAQCQRCGKHHCAEHGSAFCAACTDPVASAPSSATFRIALVALLGASVLALWLLVRPPSVPGEGSSIVQKPSDATPAFTPALTPDTSEETPVPTGEVSATAVATATATPEPTDEPTEAPTAEPTAPPQIEYTVQSGDSWNSIADAYGVDATTLASFNGYALSDILPLGITLVIPQ